MCEREMTLGEEIINLATRGIETSTVERMYRKYTEIEARTVPRNETVTSVSERLKKEIITRKLVNIAYECKRVSISAILEYTQVGDQFEITLEGLGTFTATAQKITNDKVLFIFDDYITKRPMYESSNNISTFDESDLKKWIGNELSMMFPEYLRERMFYLSIPTLGEICGWDNSWDRLYIGSLGREQLPLMKRRRNRVAYYNDEYANGWLRNRTISGYSFACVNYDGGSDCDEPTKSFGVRPEFWLWK